MVPPSSNRISRVPPYLFAYLVPRINFRLQGYHLLWPSFPECSTNLCAKICQALPRSLAATEGISVDFFSCGYLDVSVPHVRFQMTENRGQKTVVESLRDAFNFKIQIQLFKTKIKYHVSKIKLPFLIRYFPPSEWSEDTKHRLLEKTLLSVLCLLSSDRVPPFRHLRINAYLPTPRSFSQAITSFIASDCQGIRRLRLFSWSLLYNKLLKISSCAQDIHLTCVASNHSSNHLYL